MTCLLDTGSMVTTVTEGFFRKHICPTGDVESTSSWLKLKAANGLDIPYIGYVELDVEVLGKVLPKRGILIIKDPQDPSIQPRRQDIPGLLGMNVIGACKELLTQDHEVTVVEGGPKYYRREGQIMTIRSEVLLGWQDGVMFEYRLDQYLP